MADRTLTVTTKVRDLASRELKQVGKTGNKAGHSIAAGFIKAQLAIAAVKMAVRGAVRIFQSFTTEVAEQGDKIEKMSLRLGISTEALSKFEHAANLAGVEFRAFAISLQRQGRRVGEAAAGMGEALKALEEMRNYGLGSAQELARMAPEDQFLAIAEALEKVEGQADRLRLAFKLWDSEGVRNLQIINQGTDALRQQMKEAERYGIVWTKAQARISAAFVDARHRLDQAVFGIKKAVALELLPALTEALERLANWLAENRDKIKATLLAIIKAIASFTLKAVRFIVVVAGKVKDIVVELQKLIEEKSKSMGERMKDFLLPSFGDLYDEWLRQQGAVRDTGAAWGREFDAMSARILGDLLGPLKAVTEETKRLREEAGKGRGGSYGVDYTGEHISALKERVAAFKKLDEVQWHRWATTWKNTLGSPTFFDDFIQGIADASEAVTSFAYELGEGLVMSATNNFSAAIDALIDRTKSFKEAFRDMAMSIIKDMIRIATQRAILSSFSWGAGLFQGGGGLKLGGGVTAYPVDSGKYGGGKALVITQNVYPSAGMDEQAVADLAAASIQRELRVSTSMRGAIRKTAREGLY